MWFVLNMMTAAYALAGEYSSASRPHDEETEQAFLSGPHGHRMMRHGASRSRVAQLHGKSQACPSARVQLTHRKTSLSRIALDCADQSGSSRRHSETREGPHDQKGNEYPTLSEVLQEDKQQSQGAGTSGPVRTKLSILRPWSPVSLSPRSQPDSPTASSTSANIGSNCARSQSAVPASQGGYNFLAGAIAAAIAAAVTCPLEVVKTQLQSGIGIGVVGVVAKIVAEHGMGGLFRGLTPTMLGTVPLRAFYFWAMTTAKGVLGPILGEGATTNLVASVSAGFARSFVSSPLYIVKTRMQVNGAEFLPTVRALYAAQGAFGFYRGIMLSFWGVAEGALQSLVYEEIKRRWAHTRGGKEANTLEDAQDGAQHEGGKRPEHTAGSPPPASSTKLLAAAALSKVVSSLLLYPHEVLLTRLSSDLCDLSALASFHRVAALEGLPGLYAGLGVHLLRVVPNTAIMFMLFEILQRLLPRLASHPCWQLLADRLAALPTRLRNAPKPKST